MDNRFYNRDIVSIADLSREDMEQILDVAAILKETPHPTLLNGKVIASCFFEASTRTRLSFETAIHRLGGTLIGFADGGNTSAKKGETLADAIRMVSSYTDAIIMRHPKEGAARMASEFSGVPIINGGDGANQHPTQTLLDLFSIKECQGQLDNLTVTFVGDLKYGRTVHSLAQALTHFNATFNFIAPDALAMPDYLLQELDEKGIRWQRSDTIEEVIANTDIVYMTRVQKERFDETEYKHIASKYVLTNETLKTAPEHLKVLHPLPRVDEIAVEVDQTPHAYYFEQARNGVYARQALLALILNETGL
ncbi:aspartate carbamoyltransferase [uncultured Endozoicomonas sp.]|uniref:aspartate carbamoyltransferase n=1 Tax=uncultured Endozoicomonas sp. TaxID=432652 RepID=UPI00260AE663|nr:aspartate carbamoyltransferase [uncultured Endozoicomonas sp.]